MIKIEHTLFSLPFALSSALLALDYLSKRGEFPSLQHLSLSLVWISLALFGARSMGMALNRIIDKDIDALNPRTKTRELPSAKLALKEAYLLIFFALILYIYATLHLPRLCQILSPIPLIWVSIYPYLKRFTYLSHLFLGTTLGGATLGAWIAITGSIDNMAPLYLALGVMFWVTGFDIVYATQDQDFDRSQGLHSIPQRFGFAKAIWLARFMHLLTVICLYLAGEVLTLGLAYKLAILSVILALLYEQKLVSQGRIEQAFFVVNSWVSVLILFFVVLEVAW